MNVLQGMAAALLHKLGIAKVKVWEGTLERLGTTFHQLSAKTIDGDALDFARFKGKVVLISNGACLCGFTKNNYEQLVALDKRYGGNLQIVMFPSNEFGGQEPYDANGIKQFVQKYGVEFFMMEKTHVNGPETHPVIKALKQATGTENVDVKWNFETKFLIAKDGKRVERYSSAFETNELIPFIDRLLAEPSPAAAL